MAKTQKSQKTRAKKTHTHGQMDITAQEQTFDGFVRWSIRLCVLTAVVLIILTFTTP